MLFGVQVGMVDIEIDRDYVSVCKSEQFCWLRAISNVWETLSLPTLRWWYPPADAASISTSCSCSQFQRWTQLRKKQAGVDRAAGLAANKPVWQPEDWVWEVFAPGEKRSPNFAMVWGLNQYLLMYSSYFAFCLLLSMCELSQHASFGLEEDPEVLPLVWCRCWSCCHSIESEVCLQQLDRQELEIGHEPFTNPRRRRHLQNA